MLYSIKPGVSDQNFIAGHIICRQEELGSNNVLKC